MSALYGSTTANVTTRWHPEPSFRGTYSILSSCLITIGLCVWTAVHLNIPAHHDAKHKWWRPQFGRKMKWLLIGIFAPEVIAWVAFEQRKEAARIGNAMSAELAQGDGNQGKENVLVSHDGESSRATRCWSTTHSYFTLMGGFAIDIRESRFLVSKMYDQLTLTPAGMIFVAKNAPQLIPDIPERALKDKSKANGLAKLLVCLQAGWFCIQCITRLAQGLTISLLELNAFAHSVCTLLIYFLWWDKPLDIEEPAVLEGEGLRKFTALLVVADLCGFKKNGTERKSKLNDPSETRSTMITFYRSYYHDLSRDDIRHDLFEELDNKLFRVKTLGLPTLYVNACTLHKKNRTQEFPYADFTRSELEDLKTGISEIERIQYGTWNFRQAYLVTRATNLPDAYDSISGLVSFCIASLCYGSIHMSAWNAPFPNRTQAILWKVSALTLAGSGIIVSPPLWVRQITKTRAVNDPEAKWRCFISVMVSAKEAWSKIWIAWSPRNRFIISLLQRMEVLFLSILIMFYLFCRVYLVVESFIGMAHLPDRVYEVPQWSQYFPHIA